MYTYKGAETGIVKTKKGKGREIKSERQEERKNMGRIIERRHPNRD